MFHKLNAEAYDMRPSELKHKKESEGIWFYPGGEHAKVSRATTKLFERHTRGMQVQLDSLTMLIGAAEGPNSSPHEVLFMIQYQLVEPRITGSLRVSVDIATPESDKKLISVRDQIVSSVDELIELLEEVSPAVQGLTW